MYCRKCGKMIDDDAAFCPYCGTSTNETQSSSYSDGPTSNVKPFNAMAVVGLILSFFSPLLGWIFGGIGLKRARMGQGARGIAVAAIIIATINFVLNVYLISTGKLAEIINSLVR